MSTVIGSVSAISGRVIAIDASGNERVLALGDAIMEQDVIRPSVDAQIEIKLDNAADTIVLNGGQSWLATADTFTPGNQFPVDDAIADVDAIQAALLAGQDPTEILEPTAAGAPAAGGAGGTGGNEGADFVQLEATRNETTPEAGYQTQGISSEQPPLVAEQDALIADEPAPEPEPQPEPQPEPEPEPQPEPEPEPQPEPEPEPQPEPEPEPQPEPEPEPQPEPEPEPQPEPEPEPEPQPEPEPEPEVVNLQLFAVVDGQYVSANTIYEPGYFSLPGQTDSTEQSEFSELPTVGEYVVLAVDSSGVPLATQPGGTITVNVGQPGDGASAGEDYAAGGPQQVTVGQSFFVGAEDDALSDNNEEFTLSLGGNWSREGTGVIANYSPNNVTTTILDETHNDNPQDQFSFEDNDTAYTFQLFAANEDGSLSDDPSVINEDGETSAYYIVLAVDENGDPLAAADQPSGTVDVSFTNNGTTSDADYDYVSTTVTIGSAFSSTAVDDAFADNGETFTVALEGNYSEAADYEAVEYNTDTVETTIIDNDSIPTIGNGSVVVSEEGLDIPAEDKVGLEDTDAGTGYTDQTNDASDSGSLTITGNGTAALTVAIDLSSLPTGLESGGEPISWAYESGNETVAIGSTAAGTEVIRVELNGGDESVNTAGSTPPGSIGYTVSLSQPVDHDVNSLEDTLSFDFDVSISDGSNTPVDTGTVSVTIEDDMPAQSNDSNTLDVQINTIEVGELETGWSNAQGGNSNVQSINNGVPGQDDVVSWSPSNYSFDDNDSLINNQNVAVNSTFAIGEFTHNNFPTDEGNAIESVDLNLSFNVVINGYVATVNHTISFEHDETDNTSDPVTSRDIVTINNASTIVPITITTAEGAVETYNFEIIGFVDGSGNVVDTVYTNESASNSFQLMGQLVSSDSHEVSGQVDYGFGADGPADENSVEWEGSVNGVIQGDYGVLTVDDEGNYTYQLDQDAYDALSPGDDPVESFTYTVTDADGDGVESTLDININAVGAPQAPDLIPEGQDETVGLEVGATTTNLLITLDVSGSMDDYVSSAGKTRFEIAKESLISTFEAYQAMGETEVNLTLFASSAVNVGWMSVSDAIDYINGLEVHWNDSGFTDGVYSDGNRINIGSSTDYLDALNTTETADFTGHSADQTIGYFLSDGDPNDNASAVNSDSDSAIQDWREFIEGNDSGLQGHVDKLFVVGIGSNVSETYLDIVQVQEGESPIIVTNETQLVDTLTNTASASVSGDVSDNVSGGDGAISIDSITLYGTTYTVDGSNGTVEFPSEGVELAGQGTLIFDFTTGQYTYSVQPGEFPEGLTTKQFSVTVSDEDGDAATFNVNIEVTALDTTASEPVLDGSVDQGTQTGSGTGTETFTEDGDVSLSWTNNSHTYSLGGTATGFSLTVSSYKVSGSRDDDGYITFLKDGSPVGSSIDLDTLDDGTHTFTNLAEFDSVVVIRTDGRFTISDFSAEVTVEVNTYEYDLDMSAALTDLDGSESLSDITVDGLPTGTSITGTGVTANGDGTYTVTLNASGEAESDVKLLANRQLTDAELEGITISVTSTESSNGQETTVTATLVDGIVAGVAYLTSSGLSGMTDDNGSFEYREGDSVTFLVGNVVVGTASADDLANGQVFLQDLANVDRSDLNNEYVENMAVFLQSLDADGNPANGISISAATHAALADTSLNLQTATEAELKALIEQLGEAYVSEEEAMEHVREMLEQYAGITEFDEHVDDSIQSATLATEPVTGLTYQTSSGIEGELDAGVFEYDAGDVLSIYAGDQLVAEFDTALIGTDGVITLEEAGFNLTLEELQALLSDDADTQQIDEEPETEELESEESEAGDIAAAEEESEDEPEPEADEADSSDESEDQGDEEVSLLDDGGDIFGLAEDDAPEFDDAEDAGEEDNSTGSEEPESEEAEEPEGEPLQASDLFEEEQENSLDNLLGSGEPSEGDSESAEPSQSPQEHNVDGLVDNSALMDNLVGTPDTSSDF